MEVSLQQEGYQFFITKIEFWLSDCSTKVIATIFVQLRVVICTTDASPMILDQLRTPPRTC